MYEYRMQMFSTTVVVVVVVRDCPRPKKSVQHNNIQISQPLFFGNAGDPSF